MSVSFNFYLALYVLCYILSVASYEYFNKHAKSKQQALKGIFFDGTN